MTRFPKSIVLAAGLASATGFAPLGLWPVTLAAVAMLLMLVRDADSGRAAFLRGWLFGVGQFALGLNWIAHAFDFQDAMPHWLGYLAVALLSLYLAVYPGLAALLAWRIGGRAGRGTLTLAFAAAWIATEYLRATLFTGFAWNPLGAIAVGTPAAAYSTWLGTYGLSGLCVLVAGLLWWLGAWARDAVTDKRGRDPAHLVAAGLVSLVLVLLYLGIPLRPTVPGAAVREVGPAIRIVQPNLSLAQQRDSDADEHNVARLEALTGPPTASPRLVLWPEGAVPYYLAEESWARTRIARLLGPRDVLMTGGSLLLYNKDRDLVAARNSVFALDAGGDIVARYDKTHLVPYGEYLPMRPVLSAIGLSRLVESEIDFTPGDGSLTTRLPGFGNIGVQLCYEIIFSGETVDRNNRPGAIFNPSIDAWFGAWGPPQHLAQARLRAIEEALPVVRTTTTGISAVIDADGRVLAALPLNKGGFIASRLPAAKAPTLFARYGNTLPLAFALLLATLAIAPRFRRR
ncbi:apolipoprotein N-acyltransferase [Sphingomonas sp. SUN039]|uniref:apolipoprotein N-acyltransferase n=1 Tax=Sphingomonas sp. SUN039 TaxID=2937787 RepID=UPI0021648B89|nr:apolipoprotein N-acyltransferase [Sphingomonas sp. SUN039]UVO55519.1 apolipoprotein N-acyltransferase [Sphingomonas sp. SUN039]